MDNCDKDEIERVREAKETWETTCLKDELEKRGEWKRDFKTNSRISVNRVYTPLDLKSRRWSYLDNLGFPGEYPFTRGITPTMHRGTPPLMFVYQGFGSAEATNERARYLIAQGATELLIATDLPTQIGYDSDHPLSRGEVGKIGVPINSLRDMEIIFDGIPLDKVVVGAQANATAPIIVPLIIAAAEKRGVPPQKLRCTVQNDILKEFIARGTYIFPPKPSVKFSCDLVEYVVRNKLSGISPIQYCGYHMREAGGNAVQEMAFTLANAVTYIEEILRRGISVDEIPPPRGAFIAGMDLFEEVCKLRGFRRMWARLMKERFRAKNPLVMAPYYMLGSQASLYTAQQPMNNVVRGTVSALVQMLSGVRTMNIGAMDEALSIPTEESSLLLLRTLQIACYETGILNTVDPLGGSYYVEALTDELEEKAAKLFEEVQKLGGSIPCIEQGFQEKQIAREAYEQTKQFKSGDRIHVGVNKFQMDVPLTINLMKVDPKEEERQIEKVKRLRRERDNRKVEAALRELKEAAIEGVNLISPILTSVKVYATGGEICDTLRGVWGEYKRPVY
jgi:methylmalonyl-CoA mutase N-terminal domain/subunit